MLALAPHVHNANFRTVSLRPEHVTMGHVLNVDHFHMSQPIFPPHPHAGFSAITWMLPWSKGGFLNRDSRGDRSFIGPGALHVTTAGAGMMHEEVPSEPGVDCEGLQIFVKLPADEELGAPRTFHADAGTLPTLRQGESTAQVLLGQLDGVSSQVTAHAETMMAHVSVRVRLQLEVPAQRHAFAMVLRGTGQLGNDPVAPAMATSLAAGPLQLAGESLELLIGWSAPMPKTPVFRGPFCMFDPERLVDAARRFQAGGMGHIPRS